MPQKPGSRSSDEAYERRLDRMIKKGPTKPDLQGKVKSGVTPDYDKYMKSTYEREKAGKVKVSEARSQKEYANNDPSGKTTGGVYYMSHGGYRYYNERTKREAAQKEKYKAGSLKAN